MPGVLIVDDEPAIRKLVRASLERAGYAVIEAANGADALRLARAAHPDLVLLDIALPGISGTDVCRRLKQDPALSGTPVLIMSGIVNDEERLATAECAAYGLISKPFSPAALLAEVERVLSVAAPLS